VEKAERKENQMISIRLLESLRRDLMRELPGPAMAIDNEVQTEKEDIAIG